MLVPNRHANTPEYRYGFQGQEMDDELKGEGNSLNYTYRMHDPRVGRFLSLDPLAPQYPHYTPYSFSGNKVIAFRELEGLEEYYYYNAIAQSVGSVVLDLEPMCNACKNPYEFAPNLEEYGYFLSKDKAQAFGVEVQKKILADKQLADRQFINKQAQASRKEQ